MARTRQTVRNETALNHSRKNFGLSTFFNGAETIQEKLTAYFPLRKRRCSEDEPCDKVEKRCKKSVINDTENTSCGASTSYSTDVISSISYPAWNVIIEHIPLRGLMQYALTCKRMSQRLRDYALTKAFSNRFIKSVKRYEEANCNAQYNDQDPFTLLGHFLKAVTFSEITEARVDVLIDIFELTRSSISDTHGWGRCLHSFTDKWHFAECEKLLRAMMASENCRLAKGLAKLLESPAGTFPELEVKVRNEIRHLFLDHRYYDQRERSFWLSALIKSQPTIDLRARLFMLLHMSTTRVNIGGDEREVIDWEALCNDGVATLAESLERIRPISEGLIRLYLSQKIEVKEYKWSHSDVFNIMEEVTTFPEPWCLDNFTALMVHEPRLLTIGVFARMGHNFEEEAGTITANVKSLAYRWNLPVVDLLLEPLRHAIQWITPTKRKEYYNSVVNANAALLTELASGVMTAEVSEELHAQSAMLPVMVSLTRFL